MDDPHQPQTRFISEPIEAIFKEPPFLLKKPGCPDAFRWRGNTYHVQALLSEWHDYGRRGRSQRNIRPARLKMAARRGSWGVGRDYYRVQVSNDHIFEIYFDRAPKNNQDRQGVWMLDREIVPPPREL